MPGLYKEKVLDKAEFGPYFPAENPYPIFGAAFLGTKSEIFARAYFLGDSECVRKGALYKTCQRLVY